MQQTAIPSIGQIADVDLRLLKVFKAVADCGGMAAAELELNLAMSTISRHVKDLETRLGLVLCRRGRGGFALTPEGTRVYAAAQHLIAATDAFRGELHDIHRRMGGDLHVALFEKTATNPESHIPQAIRRFRAIAPQVNLHLHVGPIGMIERGVIDGQYHLGIIPEHRRSESLDYLDLFGETMQLYASEGHPWFRARDDAARDWAALQKQALAALGYHSPNMALTHARRLERAATASDQEAVANLILSGAYVGFLPDHYARVFVEAKQMRAVAPAVLRYECRFACIWRHAPGPSRVAEAFRVALHGAHQPHQQATT
ncbi:LysR family transcriptional regulator [Hydrogenophaga crassostreae]|uniref:LysR family transcriptional regulator n=1 Tax=Hydrogenophaga crassostreae TaxID=1763535 RepID=A0A167GCB0_9BURK|nr:LysR family transcriptional regulator [Hydrogenophaga crassostreae]AOW15168.1 LysR family transcriptional regulator [Hydrogenophaga crassostreae]OAD39257.1 LysR family transcriptional regulator [Hydrogenophaga crassostreae]